MSCARHCGDVLSVLKDVAVPAPATGTVCTHHAEGAQSVTHRAQNVPMAMGGREWGED